MAENNPVEKDYGERDSSSRVLSPADRGEPRISRDEGLIRTVVGWRQGMRGAKGSRTVRNG